MTPPVPSAGRSVLLTVVCAFAAMVSLQTAWASYMPEHRVGSPPWTPPFVLGTALLALVGLVALWRFRRWGLWLYLAVVLLQNLALIWLGRWVPATLLLPALVGLGAAWNRDRLRPR